MRRRARAGRPRSIVLRAPPPTARPTRPAGSGAPIDPNLGLGRLGHMRGGVMMEGDSTCDRDMGDLAWLTAGLNKHLCGFGGHAGRIQVCDAGLRVHLGTVEHLLY